MQYRQAKHHGDMKRKYLVTALWDPDAHIVFYSESDIEGLHIEADTMEEFEAVMVELAPDLIIANHLSPDELVEVPLRELIPSIVLRSSGSAGVIA